MIPPQNLEMFLLHEIVDVAPLKSENIGGN